jgi:hypothetical protein
VLIHLTRLEGRPRVINPLALDLLVHQRIDDLQHQAAAARLADEANDAQRRHGRHRRGLPWHLSHGLLRMRMLERSGADQPLVTDLDPHPHPALPGQGEGASGSGSKHAADLRLAA